MITISLAKGRLADKAATLFHTIGVSCEQQARRLTYTDEQHDVSFIFTKAEDVAVYVEYGVSDMGIMGKDTLLEYAPDVYEVLDLGFGACRMCLCGVEGRPLPGGIIRVASKYPAIAADYFDNVLGRRAEIIKLHGSVELAPLTGLSDCIVDIVESGATLRENGLCVISTICDLSARLVVNRASMKVKYHGIMDVVGRLQKQL